MFLMNSIERYACSPGVQDTDQQADQDESNHVQDQKHIDQYSETKTIDSPALPPHPDQIFLKLEGQNANTGLPGEQPLRAQAKYGYDRQGDEGQHNQIRNVRIDVA